MEQYGEWRHLCVDMQRTYSEETPWHVPWMSRVTPKVEEVAGRYPEKTVFTRFVPPVSLTELPGKWQDYYRKWWMMTREHLAPELIDLVPALSKFVPPAKVFDKATYSPWMDGRLHQALRTEQVSTLVVSGGETDVCVLAAVLGAIDLGYRVILLSDAICSGADETHDASMKLLGDRFSVQLEIMTSEEFLSRTSS
jgi:nicotinamidase-related amidase